MIHDPPVDNGNAVPDEAQHQRLGAMTSSINVQSSSLNVRRTTKVTHNGYTGVDVISTKQHAIGSSTSSASQDRPGAAAERAAVPRRPRVLRRRKSQHRRQHHAAACCRRCVHV
jgi:hypothetical protein